MRLWQNRDLDEERTQGKIPKSAYFSLTQRVLMDKESGTS